MTSQVLGLGLGLAGHGLGLGLVGHVLESITVNKPRFSSLGPRLRIVTSVDRDRQTCPGVGGLSVILTSAGALRLMSLAAPGDGLVIGCRRTRGGGLPPGNPTAAGVPGRGTPRVGVGGAAARRGGNHLIPAPTGPAGPRPPGNGERGGTGDPGGRAGTPGARIGAPRARDAGARARTGVLGARIMVPGARKGAPGARIRAPGGKAGGLREVRKNGGLGKGNRGGGRRNLARSDRRRSSLSFTGRRLSTSDSLESL